MKYSVFDLHCDTAHKIRKINTDLLSRDLHVQINEMPAGGYIQTAAIWSPAGLSDRDCWQNFLDTLDNFKRQLSLFEGRAVIAENAEEIKETVRESKYVFIPAVEDARLLSGDLSRIDILRSLGVRFMTLTWKGETVIGGSFDTSLPLTDFGKSAVRRMYEIGIIPDISHSSIETALTAADIADEYNKPFIATHSNSRAVYDHPRNLTPEIFDRLLRSGGIVGISFCTKHLCDESLEECDVSTVMRHIDYYLSRGGEKALCLGCDYDGIDHPPKGLEFSSRLDNLAEAMLRAGYSESTVNDVFFGNAMAFAEKNLKQ
ncbi:MAG: membrane dipeptidase [Clostridia bacterium]|nr:membrane dipeptidase [Clostridia bacterium]